MKITLPTSLRAALIAALSVTVYSTTASADFSGEITADVSYDTAQTVSSGSEVTVSNSAVATMPSLTIDGTVNASDGTVVLQTETSTATSPTMEISSGATVSGAFRFQEIDDAGESAIGSGKLILNTGSDSSDLSNASFEGIAEIEVSGGTFTAGEISATDSFSISDGELNVSSLSATSLETSGGTLTSDNAITATTLTVGGGTVTANSGVVASTLAITTATVFNLKATEWSDTALLSYDSLTGTPSDLTTNLTLNISEKAELGSVLRVFSTDELSLSAISTTQGDGYSVTSSESGKWVYTYSNGSSVWNFTVQEKNGTLVVIGNSEGDSSVISGADTGVSLVLNGSGESQTLTATGTIANATAATTAQGGSSLTAGGATVDVYSIVTTTSDGSTTENYISAEVSEIAKIQNADSVTVNRLTASEDAEISSGSAASVNTDTISVNEGTELVLDGVKVAVSGETPSDSMQGVLAANDIDTSSSKINGSLVLKNNAGLTAEASPVTVNNGFIGGTGSINGIALTGTNTLKAGNSPGVLSLSDVTTSSNGDNTWVVTAVTNTVESGTLNSNTDTQISQFRIVDNVVLNGQNTFALNLETAVSDATGATTYSAATNSEKEAFAQSLTKGTSFRFFNLSDGSFSGSFTSYDFGGTLSALLNKGLIWDISDLTKTGEATVRSINEGDGTRVANTLVSSAQTLFAFADGARNHVYSNRTTGSNLWVSGLGNFQDVSTHNGRSGYKYNGGGYAIGMDHQIRKNSVIGLTFGQVFGNMKPKGSSYIFDRGKIDQDTTMIGLYGGTLINMCGFKQGLQLDGYVAYGSSDNKSSRSSINSLIGSGTSTANWNEDVFAVGGRVGWVYQVCPAYNLRPFIGLDYTASRMDSFRESGINGVNYSYSAGHYQNLALSAGFAIDRTYTFSNGMALTPAVGIAYVGDVVRKDGKVTVSNPDGSSFTERSVSPGRNAIRANAMLTWKICNTWNANASYVFEYRSGATLHGVNAGISYSF